MCHKKEQKHCKNQCKAQNWHLATVPCAFCQYLTFFGTQYGSRKRCKYPQNMSLNLHMKHHDSSCSSIQSLCAFKTKTNKNHCKTQKKETGRFQGGLAYVYIYICIYYIYMIYVCVYIYICHCQGKLHHYCSSLRFSSNARLIEFGWR